MNNNDNRELAHKIIESISPPSQMMGFFSIKKPSQVKRPGRPRPAPALIYKKGDLEPGVCQSKVDKAFDLLFEATAKKISTEAD